MGWMPRSLLPASIAAASLLGSCTVMYGDDADARQCKAQADCDQIGATLGVALVCSDGVCEASDAGAQVGPRACKADNECGTNNLCGFDGYCYAKWGCLDEPRDFSPADVNPEFRASIRRFEDISDLSLVGTLDTTACLSTDPSCTKPVVASGAAQLSADKTLTVPFRGIAQTGFIGRMQVKQVTKTDAGVVDDPNVLPAYYHFTSENPLVTSITSQTELMMVGPFIFPVLSAQYGINADPNLATVVLQVHDCGGRKAADVSLTPLGGASGSVFVAVTGKATPILGLSTTTEDGAALLLNVQSGGNLLFALRDEKQGRVLSDAITFLAYGRALNYFVYYPRRSALERWMNYAKTQSMTP
jgi:hypothetical protein